MFRGSKLNSTLGAHCIVLGIISICERSRMTTEKLRDIDFVLPVATKCHSTTRTDTLIPVMLWWNRPSGIVYDILPGKELHLGKRCRRYQKITSTSFS
ncbi:hypothetical protein TNCT_314241 [Trichonephila clavata]|uniref:Uncharacterized protein n=1 Tax=Trichonephila clavata TaxID=2740835 RepID=A0A8X6LJH6_TRICU|nr:hypothetical protein TNCT_314241 [Trichonephila clavata]